MFFLNEDFLIFLSINYLHYVCPFFFLVIKRNYLIFDFRNFLFDADQNARFSVLTYLRLTQFSYTEIESFPDDFMFLNK